MLQEKIGVGREQVEEIYNRASMGGYQVIKLLHNSPTDSQSIKEINGVEVLTDVQGFSRDPMQAVANVGIEKGRLYFYPDARGFNWGYMVKTENNMKRLVHSLSQGDYRIADQEVLREAIQIAKESGLDTEPKKIQSEFVRLTAAQKDDQKKLAKLEEEKKIYEQKIALLEKKAKAAEAKVAAVIEETSEAPEEYVEVTESGEAAEKTPPKKTRKA